MPATALTAPAYFTNYDATLCASCAASVPAPNLSAASFTDLAYMASLNRAPGEPNWGRVVCEECKIVLFPADRG